jgi:aspartate aminotransferase-like enzyme
VSKNLLFIPGPVTVAETVLAATAQPMIDHRGPEFRALLEKVASHMKPIFGTTTAEVMVLGGSGTGGLEAAVGSMFGPGDRILACPIGVFGQRFVSIARAFGIEVDVLETAWGSTVDPEAMRAKLATAKYDGVLLTHNETSTGVQNPMAPLAHALRDFDGFVIVDSVSGLGASDFRMDEWRFDVVVTASQKALSVPPGIALVAVGPRAWTHMEQRKGPVFYFDLRKAREFAKLGQTPWTPPVSIVYGLDVALDEYEQGGAEAAYERHDRYARAIRAAAAAMGLKLFSSDGGHSPTVVAIEMPEGIDSDKVRKSMREDRGVVVGGGQKELKGKIIRIGTMGDLTQTDILGALGAFEIGMLEAGANVQVGVGVQAALKVFLASGSAAAV